MKKGIFWAFLFMSLFIVKHSSAAENIARSLFPLEKGSYWIYKGKVEWTADDGNQKVKSKTITWRMTVHEVLESSGYKAALVTGFPEDVAGYEEGMSPQHSLLVETGNRVYWKGYQTKEDAMKAAQAITAGNTAGMSDLALLLEFPLVEGKLYDLPEEKRSDNMYAWYVEKLDKTRITVKGYKEKALSRKFTIAYRTLPDHMIMEFVEGLGIVRYVYEHHGSTSSKDLQLIEYGTSKQSSPGPRQERGR